MTQIIETTAAPITLPAPMTEAMRRFRAWMAAEARLDTPEGRKGGDMQDDIRPDALTEADSALRAVMLSPVVTLHDLAALVVAAANTTDHSAESPMGALERAALAILARTGDELDPAAIRGRLLLACDAFVKPTVAFPVGVQPEDRAALAAMTDEAIRRDLAQPLDKSLVYDAAMRLAMPLEWVMTGDMGALLHYARAGMTEARAAA